MLDEDTGRVSVFQHMLAMTNNTSNTSAICQPRNRQGSKLVERDLSDFGSPTQEIGAKESNRVGEFRDIPEIPSGDH